MSRLLWRDAGNVSVPKFDVGDVGSVWANLGKQLSAMGEAAADRQLKEQELALKDKLVSAQADYYRSGGRGRGGSGSGSGVAATDWEAYKANAGLVTPQQGQGTPASQQAPEAPLERPVAPVAKELPVLLEPTDKRLGEINPAYGATLQALTDLTQQHDAIKAAGGNVNPEVAKLQSALDDVRRQTVIPNAQNITPEQVAEINPEYLKTRSETLGTAAKYLEDQIAKAQGKAYASPELVAKRNQTAQLAPVLELEREKALQQLNESNNAISSIRSGIMAENIAARNDFLARSKAFEEATKGANSQAVVNNITEQVASGANSKTSEGFPDLGKMSLNELQQYRSRFRESYLGNLNQPLTTPPEYIQKYRQDAIANLEAKAAAYGRTPTRKEIAEMERSIGPGAAKAWQKVQEERYKVYEEEIEDWIKIKEGDGKEKSNALLNKIREGNPAEVHKELTQQITGWESLGDAITPGSGGQRRAEQSINNLYTFANENKIPLVKMQEGISKALQELIKKEPVYPDWDVETFNNTLIRYLQKEKALPNTINISDLKDALMPESEWGIW